MELEFSAELSAPAKRASQAVMAAVLLLSAAGLIFEITMTRIFSATIWYHYTFVAISVAMFGWGLGGFGVYALGLGRRKDRALTVLVALSLAFAVALPLFPYAILRYPFTPERLNFYFVMGLLPFLAGGATLSLVFETYGTDSNRLYFADLIGAALGTLLVPPAISSLGAETAILATAVLPAGAAVLLSVAAMVPSRQDACTATDGRRDACTTRKWAVVPAGLAGLVLAGTVGLTAWNVRTQTLTIRDAPNKGLYQLLHEHPQATITSDRWNAYSRITSVTGFDDFHLARLFIDSDAWTNILRWDGTPEGIPDGGSWFRSFPFRMAKEPRVLVIGPGGGTDVVMAVVCGSPSVTAVEMNPLIVDCVRRWEEQAGNVYDHPKVHLVMDEGRTFMERTSERFDLIVLGFVDSWASVASGGLSLTENYLYTREAMEAYYDHLSERGALVIIRWPTDVPRLVANSVAFLSDRGMRTADIGTRLLAVADREPRGTEPIETVFMLSRSPMGREKVDELLAGHDQTCVLVAGTRASRPPYAGLLTGQMPFDQYTQAFDTLATPVDDDRPFYFATDKPYGIPPFLVHLFRLPVQAVVVFTVLLLVGSRLLGWRTPGAKTVVYFGALGVGFIVCEVALMQRMILLLGHPIYTLVVLLFTLLLACGLGSRFARRYPAEEIGRALGWTLPLVAASVVLGGFLLPGLVRATLFLNLPMRILIAVLVVFPFGFLMGMPFPLGLRRSAEEAGGAPVSVLWGINGVASVIGSIGGVVIAVAAGFTYVFLVGAACYAVAWATRPK